MFSPLTSEKGWPKTLLAAAGDRQGRQLEWNGTYTHTHTHTPKHALSLSQEPSAGQAPHTSTTQSRSTRSRQFSVAVAVLSIRRVPSGAAIVAPRGANKFTYRIGVG